VITSPALDAVAACLNCRVLLAELACVLPTGFSPVRLWVLYHFFSAIIEFVNFKPEHFDNF
jgi:hypothetical protein